MAKTVAPKVVSKTEPKAAEHVPEFETLGDMLQSSQRREYDRGVVDGYRLLLDAMEVHPYRTAGDLLKDPTLPFAKARADATKARAISTAFAEAIKKRMAERAQEREPGEDPAIKSARTRSAKRALRDQGQAAEFALLIRGGETTETARAKMGIGAVKAKRIRAIAVRLKLIDRRQRKPHPT
jgi:hypothetical protein